MHKTFALKFLSYAIGLSSLLIDIVSAETGPRPEPPGGWPDMSIPILNIPAPNPHQGPYAYMHGDQMYLEPTWEYCVKACVWDSECEYVTWTRPEICADLCKEGCKKKKQWLWTWLPGVDTDDTFPDTKANFGDHGDREIKHSET